MLVDLLHLSRHLRRSGLAVGGLLSTWVARAARAPRFSQSWMPSCSRHHRSRIPVPL